MKKKFQSFLLETCAIYTAVVFCVNLVMIFQYNDAAHGANFSSGRMLLFLPAALFLSAATAVRTSEKITGVFRWLAHCVLCVLGIYLFAVLPSAADMSGAQKLVGFFITLLVYLLILLLVSTVFRRVKRAETERERYQKKF